MSHAHEVVNIAAAFKVDPKTRKVSSGEKKKLIQYDHNSTRYAVELPRMIGGHDMMLCNKVEVIYINISKDKRARNEGLYQADDFTVSQTDEDVVTFTWLVSRNATRMEGIVAFLICFTCLTDGVVDYAWNTELCSDEISVGEGQYNAESIVEMYADVLEQWKTDLFGTKDDAILSINEAAEKAIASIPEDYTALCQKVDNIADYLAIEVNVDEEGNATLSIVPASTVESTEVSE